jgi:hypothetical protein
LQVFNRWTAGVGRFVENVRLIAPDQTTVLRKTEVRFDLRDPRENGSTISVFNQLELVTPGIYYLEVLVDDVLKIRYPLNLILAPPPPPPPGSPPPAPPETPPAS